MTNSNKSMESKSMIHRNTSTSSPKGLIVMFYLFLLTFCQLPTAVAWSLHVRQFVTTSLKRSLSILRQSAQIETVPEDIPMSFPYENDTFYVRDCYSIYYDQIHKLFNNRRKQYISITGTPGIGKSIFYFYVFKRIREEYPNKIIVTASFSKDRDLERCVVFYPEDKKDDGIEEIRSTFKIKNAIHLYDGPPRIKPYGSKMIAFTSPNAGWLDSVSKVSTHCKLFMPVWTFEELCDANELLELGIEYKDLKYRYEIFGGVARYCLGSVDVVNEGMEKMEEALGNIKSLEDVYKCFRSQENLNRIVHRLFYYNCILREGFYFKKSLYFGSNWIEQRINERIQDTTKSNREEVLNMLNGISEAVTIRGWVFEGYAHDIFLNGGEFDLFSLNDSEKKLTLKLRNCKKSGASMQVEMLNNTYTPLGKNFEALDSFYYSATESKKQLFLFQITISADHDVNANGLMKALEITGSKEEVVNGNIEVILVFVIPKSVGKNFKKQKIIFEYDVSVQELDNYPVTNVKGIASAKEEQLRNINITTGRHLFDAVKRNASEISFIRQVAENFVEKVSARDSLKFIENIPQFYLAL